MDGFTLILYPLIDGGTGFETAMSDDQWTEYGAVLRQIHATRLVPPLVQQVPEETFLPQYGPVVRALMAHRNAESDGYARELSAFWQTRHDEILAIVGRAEALGRMLQQKPADLVVCHADIHRYNTLIDHSGKLHIIDWDETLLAPKERDLMFVVNGAATSTRSHEEVLFFRGYGDCEVDALALAYYRYEWVVQEISDFGERIFSRGDLGASSKVDALQEFIQLFDAGDVVEAAYQADAELQSSRKA